MTLFVTRARPVREILSYTHRIRHVSFSPWLEAEDNATTQGDILEAPELTDMVDGVLATGLWVTVEYAADRHALAAERLQRVWTHPNFIAQPWFKLPHTQTPRNITLKLGEGRGLRRGFWTMTPADLARARAWTPFRTAVRHEIVAREDDLA